MFFQKKSAIYFFERLMHMLFWLCEITNFAEIIILTLFAMIPLIFNGICIADVALIVVKNILILWIALSNILIFYLRFGGEGKRSKQFCFIRISHYFRFKFNWTLHIYSNHRLLWIFMIICSWINFVRFKEEIKVLNVSGREGLSKDWIYFFLNSIFF